MHTPEPHFEFSTHGQIKHDLELSMRLEQAAAASYDRHCGPKSTELAEGDLLGDCIKAIQAAMRIEPLWMPPMDEKLDNETEGIALAVMRDMFTDLLSRLPEPPKAKE